MNNLAPMKNCPLGLQGNLIGCRGINTSANWLLFLSTEKSGTRVIHGVTLHELHGEDVDLHDSNTKAMQKRQQSPNSRRVMLTNAALESGDVVHIHLSGSGCCRLGFTNYFADESGNISDLTGFSLFEDDLFETSKNKQVEIIMDGEALEAVYCDRYEADNNTIHRKIIPSQLNHGCLFLFCEIVFGNIHISIETVDGAPLLNDNMTGEQILLDDRGFAMLNNTSGSVVIPEVEMKAEQPFLITVKPKQNHSKNCLIVRYGLTNVPPTETTENTLMAYCLAGARVKDEDDVGSIHNLSWFHIDEIRVEHCYQVFTVCLSKDLGIMSNMNRDYEEMNFVVMGPDLQKPMWLVVEVFEADVIIEVPHQLIDEPVSEGLIYFLKYLGLTARKYVFEV